METPSRFTFAPDGSTTVFQIPVQMKGDNYVRIDIDGVIINDRNKFDIVNNSIVFVNNTDVPVGSILDILVVQTDEGIANLGNVNSIDIVSQNINIINTVATDIAAVVNNSNNMTAIQAVDANMPAVLNAAQAAIDAAASEAAAKASENASKASENASKASEDASKASEVAAENHKDAAAASATAANTSLSNALAAEMTAIQASADADTSKNAAKVSETNAAASAVFASTDASIATTKASEASTSATNAATSETNAAASASSAQASKDAALAALDNFDDRYLGQKTSDPATDNDGDPLVSGALYFNTTDEIMKVYDGSLWVAAYASLSGAMLGPNNLSDVSSVSDSRNNLGLGAGDTPTFAGLTTTGDVSFGDNDKAIFGDGSDLQIYHDGSNSYIKEAGQGALVLQGTHMYLKSTADEYYLKNTADGSVEVYHNGSAKLATTSTGVDVTGTITSDGLTVSNNAAGIADAIELENFSGDSSYIKAKRGLTLSADYDNNSAAAQSNITFETDGSEAMLINGNGDISFYEDTGTTPKFFWDASAEALGIGTSSPSSLLDVVSSGNTAETIAEFGNASVNGGLSIETNGNLDWGFNTLNSRNMTFSTNQIERMRISSSGNISATGTITATSFVGDGSALTGLPDSTGGTIILVNRQGDGTQYSTTNAVAYQTAQRFQTTPSSSTSKLMGWFTFHMRAASGGSTADMSNLARVHYFNSSSAWVGVGDAAQNVRIETGSTTGQQDITATLPVFFDQSNLNPSGDWDIAIRHVAGFNGTSTIVSSGFTYMEYEQ